MLIVIITNSDYIYYKHYIIIMIIIVAINYNKGKVNLAQEKEAALQKELEGLEEIESAAFDSVKYEDQMEKEKSDHPNR